MEKGVGAGIAIFIDGNLTFQLRYNLAEKCSNNQAEHLAMAKALEKAKGLASSTENPTKSSHTYR